jgi:protein-tyrosine phosphatase
MLERAVRAALVAPYAAVFYPWLALRRVSSAIRPDCEWRTWITETVLLGGFLLPSDVAGLVRDGVRAVVNVSCELVDPTAALRAARIDYLRVPCWDTRAPTLDDAERGVRFVARHVGLGLPVYVHCASGVGRSVALAICYLAAYEGFAIEEAERHVMALRPRVAMRPVQRRFIESFVARYRILLSIPQPI